MIYKYDVGNVCSTNLFAFQLASSMIIHRNQHAYGIVAEKRDGDQLHCYASSNYLNSKIEIKTSTSRASQIDLRFFQIFHFSIFRNMRPLVWYCTPYKYTSFFNLRNYWLYYWWLRCFISRSRRRQRVLLFCNHFISFTKIFRCPRWYSMYPHCWTRELNKNRSARDEFDYMATTFSDQWCRVIIRSMVHVIKPR